MILLAFMNASEQLDNLIGEFNNGRNEITQILGRSLLETSRRMKRVLQHPLSLEEARAQCQRVMAPYPSFKSS